jgi:hypothetical protein
MENPTPLLTKRPTQNPQKSGNGKTVTTVIRCRVQVKTSLPVKQVIATEQLMIILESLAALQVGRKQSRRHQTIFPRRALPSRLFSQL